MTRWLVTWYDGACVRHTMLECDAYSVMIHAMNAGIHNLQSIIRIEQVPR